MPRPVRDGVRAEKGYVIYRKASGFSHADCGRADEAA